MVKLLYKIILIFLLNPAWATIDNHSVHIITSDSQVRPDARFLVGVQIKLKPGWHTYWSNPGDVGQAPVITWDKPEELQLKPLPWSKPERLASPIGKLTSYSYIYEKEVIFLYEARLDASYSSTELPLTLKMNWAICKDLCQTKETEKTLYLKVSSNFKKSRHAASIDSYQKKLSFSRFQGKFERKKQALVISFNELTPEECVDILPASPEDFKNIPAQIIPSKQGVCSFNVASSQNPLAKISGGLVHKRQGQLVFSQFHAEEEGLFSLIWFALLAFIGGLLLNLMPCVLPIIFLKLYNTLDVIKTQPHRILVLNISYALGVISSFLLLASVILFFKWTGSAVGWGFHLQSPGFILFLIVLFIAMGLYLLNFFKFYLPSITLNFKGDKIFSHFVTGVLSTTAASPCTVPFMASSVGFAFSQSYLEVLVIFFFLGLGLSFPYLFLSLFPHWFEKLTLSTKALAYIKKIFAIPLFLTAFWLMYLFKVQTLPPAQVASLPNWKTFQTTEVEQARVQGKNIFIAFGAKWCLTCLSNEVVLKNQDVIQFFKDNQINLYYGDWTKPDKNITKFLQRYGREGVPFYIFYKGARKTKLFSTFLIQDSFLKDLKKALKDHE